MTFLNFAVVVLIIVVMVGFWWWVEVGSARTHMRQALREVTQMHGAPQRRRDDPAMAGVMMQPDPESRTLHCRRTGDPKWWQQ